MPLLDKLRKLYGVGPVCSELHIAPSTYYHCQQQRHHPDKRSPYSSRICLPVGLGWRSAPERVISENAVYLGA